MSRMSMNCTSASTPSAFQRLGPGLDVTAAAISGLAVSANLAPTMHNTILFVHGFSLSQSTDCSGDFAQMMSWMQSTGFNGSMVKVGYYYADTNCDVNLHNYGSYGDSDSWKNVAAAFSHYVYNTYTSKGITVDVV